MTSNSRPNVLVRLWLGFWRGLTAFRMAVFNILFLIVLALVIRILFFSSDEIIVDAQTTLVIEPDGVVVEEYTGAPLDRAINEALGQELPETRLRDILAALEHAADDDRIVQVLVRTDKLWGLAPGMQTELADAFARFRESGKTVIAHGGMMMQSQYMLASMADEIWLDRDGMLLFDGYSQYRQYYAEGLDKLKVDVNLFRVGEYKSAMEPFIRNDMSEADRRATEAWLGDLWQNWLDRVALHRGLPVEVLVELTENFSDAVEAADGDLAAMALERGLVDRLVSRPELRAELANSGTGDPDTGFRQIDFETYAAASREWHPRADRVGIIVAQGAITEGNQPQGTIGSESTSRLIRQAARDDRIKAVVLRVNSGGGSAFASEVIRNELMALKESGKPVIVSMSNVAASGGYWIAMGADEVWAYPTTLTGSIGIFGFFPTFQDTLAQIGIHTDGVGTTPLSGALRADRELQEPARNLFQSFIEHGYREFITLVAEHRRMSVEEVDQVAQGRVWTGTQAQRRGLVDQLGTLEEAVASAARSAGIGEDYQVQYVERRLSAFEQFFVDMAGASIRMAGIDSMRGLAGWLPPGIGRQMIDELRLVFSQAESGRPGVMAHCLCEAPR
ncbi:signal peptide peptidase SppA [Wenzhouxiangella sediminis]|uniref:Signal peptide peptidase SppA n=1 Tax=Wenzhouxiangella sediminis TaxID=1792836 RepID=A0A3E1KA49_9GAMM|nr:signal peptide peptidase SppA [Wenzhouxiangella sediminis]RFF30987.1 signal peptide peptidase SppA [Wenzhouxiangella sediminis]